jgi:hypothetical protein
MALRVGTSISQKGSFVDEVWSFESQSKDQSCCQPGSVQVPVTCGACAYGIAKRKPTRTSKREKDSPSHEKELSKEILISGQKVPMDHFIVSTPGRSCNFRWSNSHDKMFKGGVIFVDHASVYLFVVPVVNFTAGEAIRAKREFEQEMASMGVVALHQPTGNGVFTSAEFQDELVKMNQGLPLSGAGVHHQNAVAERAIGTVVSLTRTMMLHSKMRWSKEVSTKLWSMAMKCAEFIVNHVPSLKNACPLDVVLKTVVPKYQLKEIETLTKLKAWMLVPRAVAEAKDKKIIKSTWVLRQERSPDGTPTKKKGCLFYRGDSIASGVDYDASFPLQWIALTWQGGSTQVEPGN